MQQTRPRLESSHVNTECVRKEEEEEEEEKEEERKEGAGGVQEKQEPHTKDVGNKNPTLRMWGTRTPHKGCGEKTKDFSSL